MANKKQLGILKMGLGVWNSWRKRYRQTRPNLSGADLRGANLSGANLSGTNLSGADLSGAGLGVANLSGADLSGGNLSGADLGGADLSGADLSNANLIEANLIGAVLSAADLSGADLSNARLSGADLSGANLIGAVLSGADLSDADLSNACLSDAKLSGADLSGADLSGANLIGTDLTDVKLSDTILIGADLSDVDLSDVSLSQARVDIDTLARAKLSLNAIRNLLHSGTKDLLGTDDRAHIIRSIEFPPEYKAAGLAILNHFEDVVRSKYSDLDVRVTITQEGNTVTMIIETEDGGELEKVKKTLEEYSLVIRGKMAPDELLTDPLAVLDLRNQLRLAQHQLETKKEMLAVLGDMHRDLMAFRDAEVTELRRLLSEAITRPPGKPSDIHVSVTVDQNQTSTQHQHVEISPRLEGLRTSLADLAQQLPHDDPTATELADVAEELEDAARDPESAKTSPVPERVRRFFEALGDDKSRLGKTVKGVKRGAEIAQALAERYNDVAQWMGWPQVPKPLLGRESKKKRIKE